jgi:prophage antirepressor-like protein
MEKKYNVTDIVVRILGYKDIQQCGFIKRNRENAALIQRNENGSLYLTQRGLFELLMQSQKPISEHFKQQIVILLTDIMNDTVSVYKTTGSDIADKSSN